jgi:hypothetical protein
LLLLLLLAFFELALEIFIVTKDVHFDEDLEDGVSWLRRCWLQGGCDVVKSSWLWGCEELLVVGVVDR